MPRGVQMFRCAQHDGVVSFCLVIFPSRTVRANVKIMSGTVFPIGRSNFIRSLFSCVLYGNLVWNVRNFDSHLHSVFSGISDPIRIISISACMAGAVCGDHCSPISDTTVMASEGAQCNHVNHVSTQLPYALSVTAVSFVTYVAAGITSRINIFASGLISFAVGAVLLFGFLFFMKSHAVKQNSSMR